MLAMTIMTDDPTTAASLDRIELMIRRSAVHPDEHLDIAFALRVLRLDHADETADEGHAGAGDHPLVDLYRTMNHHAGSTGAGLIYLSREHKCWLMQVLDDLGRKP